MDLIVDQEQNNYKHFCKICKKGFFCGRALGGHMRAHGISDENGSLDDDDDPASDWEDKSGSGGGGGNTPPSNKRMYALRTNPNRLKSCRVCENCGKEFLSWKSFLEHGKCSSDDAESLVSSPESDGEDLGGRSSSRWSKRKRSYRTKVENFATNNCPSSEEEDLANCLMMLSNANVEQMVTYQQEDSFTSTMKEEERKHSISFNVPLMPRVTSIYSDDKAKGLTSPNVGSSNINSKGLFECKACKKVFNSHQALGGHRASHKKVKGCFAAKLDQDHNYYGEDDKLYVANDQDQEFTRPTKSYCTTTYQLDHGGSSSPAPTLSKRLKSKVHECSICHRIFTSGQALGGHKRCHWITSNAQDASTLARFQGIQDQIEHASPLFATHHRTISEEYQATLDLNLPAIQRESPNKKPLSLEVSTDIILQSWGGVNVEMKHENHQNQEGFYENEGDHKAREKNIDNNNKIINNNNSVYESNLANNIDDEADSKVKLAKLCELKDNMTTNGSSSPWLQVGIGSSNAVGANP